MIEVEFFSWFFYFEGGLPDKSGSLFLKKNVLLFGKRNICDNFAPK